jgi:D-xylose transport system substrate-binding protein
MIRIFTTIAILIFLVSACREKTTMVKVGFLLPNLVGERYQKEQAFFRERIAALGGEAIFASADNDDQLQIQQAGEMIDQGARVLVVNSVNMNTAAAIVRNAHEKNVTVIAYDRLIRNCDLDYYISFDNVMVGKMMAE